MVGIWEYRNRWHRLVVGEYKIKRSRCGSLHLCEEQSRGGQQLSGVLRAGDSGWHVAELQHGYACRLRPHGLDSMESQFREPSKPWEDPVLSRRKVERSSAHTMLVLGTSVLASGVASIALLGWQVGTGVMGLLLVHELGHVAAMRYYSLPVGPMIFVPLFGAAVEMLRQPASAAQEGNILLAGPLFGTCAALLCHCTSASLVGDLGLLMEVCNLLPLGALDGGRLLPMLSSWALPAGLAICAAPLLLEPRLLPSYALVAALAYALLRGGPASPGARRPGRTEQYYSELTKRQSAGLSAGYLSLLAVLMGALLACNGPLSRAPW